MISGYGDGGEMPHKPINLVAGAAEDANRFLVEHPVTRRRLDQVTELIEGFETPFGVELLATVHWMMDEHPNATEAEIVYHTHGWSDRKRQFSERQIGLAFKTLRNNGLNPPPWEKRYHSLTISPKKGESWKSLHASRACN